MSAFRSAQASVLFFGVLGSSLAVVWHGFVGDVIPEEAGTPEETVLLSAAFWCVLSVLRVAMHRFSSPADIDGEAGSQPPSPHLRALQAVLNNTFEQAAILLTVSFLLLSTDRQKFGGFVRTNALLFFVGRSLFATGYRRGAPGRATGFALSFIPQMLSLGLWLIHKLSSHMS